MIYKIDDFLTVESAEEAAEYISSNINETYYEEMLDDVYGEVEVCGYSYDVSLALKRIDEVAYRCGLSDYRSSMYDDILSDLERMDNEESADFYGYEVTAICDEEDTDE